MLKVSERIDLQRTVTTVKCFSIPDIILDSRSLSERKEFDCRYQISRSCSYPFNKNPTLKNAKDVCRRSEGNVCLALIWSLLVSFVWLPVASGELRESKFLVSKHKLSQTWNVWSIYSNPSYNLITGRVHKMIVLCNLSSLIVNLV